MKYTERIILRLTKQQLERIKRWQQPGETTSALIRRLLRLATG